MLPTRRAAMCHHPPRLQYPWLYSPSCALHLHDYSLHPWKPVSLVAPRLPPWFIHQHYFCRIKVMNHCWVCVGKEFPIGIWLIITTDLGAVPSRVLLPISHCLVWAGTGLGPVLPRSPGPPLASHADRGWGVKTTDHALGEEVWANTLLSLTFY